MNASPDFTAPTAVMGILIPALICLFGMVIGIVTAFRHGDARVPLGIGGLAFVALLFCLPFTSSPVRVQSSPIAFEHSASSEFTATPAAWSLLFLALITGVIVLGIGAAIRYGYGKVVLIAGAVGLVGLLVVGFSSTLVPTSTHQVATVIPPAVTTAVLAPRPIRYTTGNAPSIPIQELPGWRKNPPHEGSLGAGRAKYVLTSQQFATVDEAEAELFQSLTADVQESLAKYHSPAVGWHPTPEDLRLSGIIAERVVETFSVKVGEFENPVHRVSWLIEFDHDKSTVLLQRWEPIEAQRRSKLILSILAGASGVLGVTAMALRRRRHLPTPEANPANQLT